MRKGIKGIGRGLQEGAKWVARGAAWQIGKEAVKGLIGL